MEFKKDSVLHNTDSMYKHKNKDFFFMYHKKKLEKLSDCQGTNCDNKCLYLRFFAQ